MSDVIAVTLPIFSFIFVGMAAARLNLLGLGATDVLNKFVVCLALPALLFEAMSHVRWVDLARPGFCSRSGVAWRSHFSPQRCGAVAQVGLLPIAAFTA
jgi:malonate transporter